MGKGSLSSPLDRHFPVSSMYEIISEIEHIKSLESDWLRLSNQMKSPMLSYEWFISCIQSFGNDKKIKIIVIRAEHGITALAPLWLTHANKIKHLEIIGVRELYEPSGLLYESQEALVELMDAIISLGYPVTLLRIPTNTPVASTANSAKGCFAITRGTASSQFIKIQSTWDNYLNGLSKSRRYDQRRKRSKLEKQGNISVKFLIPTIDSLENDLMLSYSIEDKSWKGKNGSSILKNRQLFDFLSNYTKLACKRGVLYICILYVNDEAIAMHIAIVEFDTFWVLKLGHLDKFSNFSPGIQLAAETIKHCHDESLKQYEFLGSSEAWQSSWANGEHEYNTILMYPYSLTSLLSFFFIGFSFIFRRLSLITSKE